MAAHLHTSRFFGWVKAREEKPALDAADLGTAFGLEVSLEGCDMPPHRANGPNGTEDDLPEPPRF
jgi:hypothetical protein